MLPSVLDNTYHRYKQDTNSVAEWLASTAQSLGFAADLLQNTDGKKATTASEGGRLKGKDRAKAKKQSAAAKPQAPSSSTGPKYLIKIAEFIPLAQFVAAKSHKVPDSFRATIDRVIAARSGFGAGLAELGNAIDEKKDASHRYFVGGKPTIRNREPRL